MMVKKRDINLQTMVTQETWHKLKYRADRDGLTIPEVVRSILASNLRNTKLPEYDPTQVDWVKEATGDSRDHDA